jgi:hypothetical protein
MGDSSEWSDVEFLGYVEEHSKTERAMFSAEHIIRFFKLAGEDVDIAPDSLQFHSLYYDSIRGMLETARVAVRKVNDQVKPVKVEIDVCGPKGQDVNIKLNGEKVSNVMSLKFEVDGRLERNKVTLVMRDVELKLRGIYAEEVQDGSQEEDNQEA